MNKLAKLGLVIGGYVLACLAAGGMVYIYELLTQDPSAQDSSGMYAFVDLILFIGMFVVLALFPTGFGLYFILNRKSR